MPNNFLPDVDLDPAFKQALRGRVLATVLRPQRAAVPLLRIWLPAAAAVLLVVAASLFRPTNGLVADLAGVENALAAIEETNGDLFVATAEAPQSAAAQAQHMNERISDYVAQLAKIIALLEQLIVRLEAAGKDTAAAEAQLAAAKQELVAAQARAEQPVRCLAELGEMIVPDQATPCEEPMAQTRDSLGNVVGLLRTSVSSAKQAL